VFDIQDLWPDSLSATGMMDSARMLRVVDRVCSAMYRRAAHIVVPAPGIRDRLIARGVAASKISVIYNWCAESSIAPAPRGEPGPQAAFVKIAGTFDVLFAGTMGKAQALEALLDAGEILKCENPAVRLLLMGGGIEVERLKREIAERSPSNVKLLPRVPMSEVGEALSRADALIVHLKDDPLFRIAIPSKTQAYMAAGKPVIMAVAGDAAQMIRESEAGVCAQPEHARSIADAIQQLAAMGPDQLLQMGQSGKRYYRENLSLDVGV
jgi:glycosyltransferase involved in cell wall biosynthesis